MVDSVAVLDELLGRGVDVSVEDRRGCTSLLNCLKPRSTGPVGFLLEADGLLCGGELLEAVWMGDRETINLLRPLMVMRGIIHLPSHVYMS